VEEKIFGQQRRNTGHVNNRGFTRKKKEQMEERE
jgi:hypothetical protein